MAVAMMKSGLCLSLIFCLLTERLSRPILAFEFFLAENCVYGLAVYVLYRYSAVFDGNVCSMMIAGTKRSECRVSFPIYAPE